MSVRALIPVLFFGFAAVGADAAAPATRALPPNQADQAKAEKVIKEVYRQEYVGTSIPQRIVLARSLLAQAKQTQDDPAARFVLLREARDIAARAGDAPTARQAIQIMGREYAVDSLEMTLGAMIAASQAAGGPESHVSIASICLGCIDEAILSDDYGMGVRLAGLAQSSAEKARDISLVNRTRSRAKDLELTFAAFRGVERAREILQHRPDDPEANLAVGRFLCFVRNDWDAGLPHLAKGSDATLQAMSRLEPGAKEPLILMDLGSRWWELSASQTALAQRHLRQRAAHCYRAALPGLTGLNASLARKRLEAVEQERLKSMGLAPGLAGEVFRGKEFNEGVGRRVDAQIDFDWGEDAADERLKKTEPFSIRWTGLIKAPKAGKYELVIIANEGARIRVDEKLVLYAPSLVRNRNGVRAEVYLSDEPKPIQIEYWDTSGVSRLKLLWRAPGQHDDEPVPDSAYYHEQGMAGP